MLLASLEHPLSFEQDYNVDGSPRSLIPSHVGGCPCHLSENRGVHPRLTIRLHISLHRYNLGTQSCARVPAQQKIAGNIGGPRLHISWLYNLHDWDVFFARYSLLLPWIIVLRSSVDRDPSSQGDLPFVPCPCDLSTPSFQGPYLAVSIHLPCRHAYLIDTMQLPSLVAALLPLLLKAGFVSASNPPSHGGYSLVWSDSFQGAGGSLPNSDNWNVITGDLGVNGEKETYTNSKHNIQLSGGTTLQIIPLRDSSTSGGWTSGRIESKYTFTPSAGKRTMVEARIRFGSNSPSNKQGIWPAFWMLGRVIHNGGSWPSCGEIDILETIDGRLKGYGTLHCDKSPGGLCNENTGIGSTTSIPDQEWHTWRVVIDRTPGSWTDETLTWYMDGQEFEKIPGSRINNQNVWSAVAHSSLFFILNVAVGGGFVRSPRPDSLASLSSSIC